MEDERWMYCWHVWKETFGVYNRDYISGSVLVKYVCQTCGSERFRWKSVMVIEEKE